MRNMRNFYANSTKSGVITTLALVFGSVFLLLFGGLGGFILLQHRTSLQKAASQSALDIAEAGLNYYRWHLAHDPEDLTDGTGGAGPYAHDYLDPESGGVGEFSLDIDSQNVCGQTSGITISSTGSTDDFPSVKRTVRAKYVRPTVSDFSFLLNSNVWAGADREIKGPYHSNGGIRMDGENNSLVTSALSTWTCTASFGCNPAEEKPGVFGAGENSDLWKFPVPSFDFGGITVDFAGMKSLTQGGQGLYFGPSGAKGYHVILKSNRTVDVWRVESASWVWAYNLEVGDWFNEYSVISSETFLGEFVIPADCGLIFMEDHVWMSSLAQGSVVKGKVTLVAADLSDPNKEVDVRIHGNVDYTTKDGSDSFALLAQRDNLIGLQAPDQLELSGVYLAQTGKYGRNHYWNGSGAEPYWTYHKRKKLELLGTIVSNGRVGTKWNCSGSYCSGYDKRETTYDPQMSFSPPPFLPPTSPEFQLREWEEVQ